MRHRFSTCKPVCRIKGDAPLLANCRQPRGGGRIGAPKADHTDPPRTGRGVAHRDGESASTTGGAGGGRRRINAIIHRSPSLVLEVQIRFSAGRQPMSAKSDREGGTARTLRIGT